MDRTIQDKKIDNKPRDDLKDKPKDNEYHAEYRVILPDHNIRHLVERGRITRDNNGKITYIHGATLDITSTKQLEEQRVKTIEEVRLFKYYMDCIENGENYTPAMMKSITHPYLKQKLMEAICLRQAG